MIKCPFCHFENEDGALFCERCTSDLSSVAPTPAAKGPPPPPVAVPAIPIAEPMPVTVEAVPVAVEAIPMAMAEPIEVLPMAMAEPMEEPIAINLERVEPAAHAVPAIPLSLEPMPVAPTPPPPAPAPEPAAFTPQPTPTPTPELAAPVAASAPAPVGESPTGTTLPPNAQPRLLVLRGQKRNVEYPLYEGLNFIGRADEKPVDIDLEEQEPPDRIWCSRQHACINYENNQLLIEDLNSANGTYVNRTRVYPGQKRPLSINDVVQIGNVQLKVLA